MAESNITDIPTFVLVLEPQIFEALGRGHEAPGGLGSFKKLPNELLHKIYEELDCTSKTDLSSTSTGLAKLFPMVKIKCPVSGTVACRCFLTPYLTHGISEVNLRRSMNYVVCLTGIPCCTSPHLTAGNRIA